MEEKDVRLKLFFDELYLSSNPSSKNENSRAQAKKQLLFVCYFLCGIRNKFVNDAKGELTMYLDSTGVSNASIDTLADNDESEPIEYMAFVLEEALQKFQQQ